MRRPSSACTCGGGGGAAWFIVPAEDTPHDATVMMWPASRQIYPTGPFAVCCIAASQTSPIAIAHLRARDPLR
jgi:hypothetical protein